jgi:hypothetical protein
MANLTVAEFKARFPQFVDPPYAESVIQAAITDTLCNFDQGRWDCLYKRGHSLYVAHLLTIGTNQSAGNSGTNGLDAMQSKSVDGVSVNYATLTPTSFNEAFFAGTSYGREYLMLLRTVGLGGTAVCGLP